MRKTNTLFRRAALLLSACLFSYIPASAYSLKHYNTRDGLSSNSIHAIYQDHSGLLWFSTSDGLSIFDGYQFRDFRPINNPDLLSGYIISEFFETSENIFWFLTERGLIRYDNTKQESLHFSEFDIDSHIAKGPDNTIYGIKGDGYVYYYNEDAGVFEKIATGNIKAENVTKMLVDYQNTLWILSDDNNHRTYSITKERTGIRIAPQGEFRHKHQILWCYQGEKELFFIDESLAFYEYTIEDKVKHYIYDLTEIIVEYGTITSIIKDKGDYFLGSSDGGLFWLRYAPDKVEKFSPFRAIAQSGVLCVVKDKNQDIVWAGTETDGVYLYFNEKVSTENFLSNELNHTVSKPITTLFIDKTQTLRMGTAGSGLISVYDFEKDNPYGSHSEIHNTYNSSLYSATINSLTPSGRNLFWIGTESGLSYYSYAERRIRTIGLSAGGKQVRQIREVCEMNDSTLYILSMTGGVIQVRITERNDGISVRTAQPVKIEENIFKPDKFTTAYKENKSTIWLGTTDRGVYKLNCDTEQSENIRLNEHDSIQGAVRSILKTERGYWFGTDKGLVFFDGNEKRMFNEKNDFPFRSVQAIREDNSGHLWLSTDRGMGMFNTEKFRFFPFTQQEGREITKFTANAGYSDASSNLILLGGDAGYTIIKNNQVEQQTYSPEIRFRELFISSKEQNIFDFLSGGKNNPQLTVKHDQNVLSIPLVAIDYIDGRSYDYFYKLNELGNKWIHNGSSNTAFFSYLPSGKYTLSAKYVNKTNGNESPEYSIILHVLPPWYKSWWAYLSYLAVVTLILLIGYQMTVRRTKKKMAPPPQGALPLPQEALPPPQEA